VANPGARNRIVRPPAIGRLAIEARLLREGALTIAGVDEVGRGSLAGPVYAAAVLLGPEVLRNRRRLRRATDSKLLSARQRDDLFNEITYAARAISVGALEASLVDRHGIAEAVRRAMLHALDGLPEKPDAVIVDSVRLPDGSGYEDRTLSLDRAETQCLSVAAASIYAKVTRDREMRRRAERHPGYGFETNFGYGTAAHRQALAELGPCVEHRRSFAPLRLTLEAAEAR
jgi:ribonuclease HII